MLKSMELQSVRQDLAIEQKHPFELGNAKPEVVRNTTKRRVTGVLGETFTEKRQKQSKKIIDWVWFSSVQLLSRVQLFETP